MTDVKRYQKILVGLDLDQSGQQLSAGSRNAAQQARSLAERTKASIIFLHSTEREEPAQSFRYGDEVQGKYPSPEGGAALEEVCREHQRTGLSAELVLTHDKPWLDMIRYVLRGEADLVIVGKRNDVTQDGRQLGVVANKLLRKCPAPVWVVHPDHALVHERVLVAADLTPVGELAAALGAYVADAGGAELHIVHAYQIPFELQLECGRIPEEEYVSRVETIELEARAWLSAAVDRSGLPIHPQFHVGCTSPSRAISDAVSRLNPDLLVMGSLSRTGIAGLLVGNTAERMLGVVDCSLLTVKPEQFVSPVELA
jgi:nucleotide-binding universal stress UspA family protein